jgi:hypothetical protein
LKTTQEVLHATYAGTQRQQPQPSTNNNNNNNKLPRLKLPREVARANELMTKLKAQLLKTQLIGRALGALYQTAQNVLDAKRAFTDANGRLWLKRRRRNFQ